MKLASPEEVEAAAVATDELLDSTWTWLQSQLAAAPAVMASVRRNAREVRESTRGLSESTDEFSAAAEAAIARIRSL